MNKKERIDCAENTIEIIKNKKYELNGTIVQIEKELKDCKLNSNLYFEDEEIEIKRDKNTYKPIIEVKNTSTLAKAYSLVRQYDNVAVLNFASAKNPGGGFLTGSSAQEESLARSSGLYFALRKFDDEFYNYHKENRTALYSDRIIYSPMVPFFKNDNGELINCQNISVITSPAVNAGDYLLKNKQKDSNKIIRDTMEKRIRRIIQIAAKEGCTAIVLGAFGCGVFKNNTFEIARAFRKVLIDEGYQYYFDQISFAIYDNSPNKETLQTFNSVFRR